MLRCTDKHIDTISATSTTTIATMEEVAYTISESLEFACNTRNDLQQSLTTGMRELKQIQKVDNELSRKCQNFANNAQMVL